jgi:hypothetical protein
MAQDDAQDGEVEYARWDAARGTGGSFYGKLTRRGAACTPRRPWSRDRWRAMNFLVIPAGTESVINVSNSHCACAFLPIFSLPVRRTLYFLCNSVKTLHSYLFDPAQITQIYFRPGKRAEWFAFAAFTHVFEPKRAVAFPHALSFAPAPM